MADTYQEMSKPHPDAVWDNVHCDWTMPGGGPIPQTAAQAFDEIAKVDSASDARTVNNTMRHAYRVLTDDEKAMMQHIKDSGLAFHNVIASMEVSREISLAKTKVEEAVMWAVKHLTA